MEDMVESKINVRERKTAQWQSYAKILWPNNNQKSLQGFVCHGKHKRHVSYFDNMVLAIIALISSMSQDKLASNCTLINKSISQPTTFFAVSLSMH